MKTRIVRENNPFYGFTYTTQWKIMFCWHDLGSYSCLDTARRELKSFNEGSPKRKSNRIVIEEYP